ncbi:MAG: GyrI-like domain-containing protein [Cohaesibacter sp.]|nr:GyrI-like domain-containing protein [Cohaesibacter sp.]
MDISLETFPARAVIYAKEIGPYGEKAKTAWNRLWGWSFELNTNE